MQARTFCLLVEYDGTDFCGWQAQPGLASIEDTLGAALQRRLGHRPALRCAGRTDAGVHAFGQVVSFVSPVAIEGRRLAPALNRFLPLCVRVHRSTEVGADFDARQSARAKRYRYRIYVGPQRPAVDRLRAWHVQPPFDVERLRAAAAQLVGCHDFEAFRSAQCDAAHARRDMHAIAVSVQARPPLGQFVDLTFEANAFCRHMCRILAGTLVEVGRGRRAPDQIAAILASRRRAAAGVTAPPYGLTLCEVLYPP